MNRRDHILACIATGQARTARTIATHVGISSSRVHRYLRELKAEGLIMVDRFSPSIAERHVLTDAGREMMRAL